jgi:hypothetical protein
MKAWKTMIVACAAVAVAAPAANATLDRSLPSKAPQVKIAKKVHHVRLAPKVASANRVLIIVAQGPTPSVADAVGDYASSDGCTNQQLCDLLAMNCGFVTADQANSPLTEGQSTTG